MINNIITSIKLRVYYKTNTLIYSFKTIPIIGKYFSDEIYSMDVFKKLFLILYIIFILLIVYLLQYTIYIFALYGALNIFSSDKRIMFLLFISTSILLGIFKPIALKADRDSDYAINCLHMDSKKYLISNYLYQLLIMIIIFIISLLIICSIIKLPIYYAILLPLMHVSIKTITNYLHIKFINIR